MVTSANSALHNSKHPERVRFHLIYPAEVRTAQHSTAQRDSNASFVPPPN
jgi:hypothetical protein